MTIPSFSRIEVRHDDPPDLRRAARELRDLARELDLIAANPDPKMMRIAAHHAIRDRSSRLRGKTPEKGTPQ